MSSDLEAFFNPSSVAVAGASSSAMKLGNITLANLMRFDYGGKVFAIHPRAGEIMGVPAYPSLCEVGESVDVAVGVLPRELMLDFALDCADAGVRNIIVCAAGYSDAGPEGAEMQRQLGEVVRSRGMRMMGPNSVGTISTESGFVTSLMSLEPIAPGPISIVAQTGLFAGGFALWMSSTQLFGLCKVACLGNKADVDEVDVLAYLEGDGHTGIIAMYSEGVSRGREFREIASRVSRSKPIVMLKGGRTDLGMSMAASHTGSLAGEDAVYRGAMAQAGVIVVEGIDGLFDSAKALAYCPLPAGPNLGVVSITGAGTVLAADACYRRGLFLPPPSQKASEEAHAGLPDWASLSNPMDIWTATLQGSVEDGYRGILKAFAGQEDMHILLVVFTLVPESEFDGAELLDEIKATHPDKPVLACFLGASEIDRKRWFRSLEERRIPVYDSIERSIDAAWALATYAAYIRGEGRRSP
ncbi:MAG: CoA-binding protein [Actinobacteria bacterium]|nr:CoA-binding protein [Actinomycetota bacterium]